MMRSANRSFRPYFWKVAIFDSIVPDAIKITSKTPLLRHTKNINNQNSVNSIRHTAT